MPAFHYGRVPRSAVAMMLPLLAILSGCDDPAFERGTPPAISLDQSKAEVPLYRNGAARVLRQQVGAMAPDGLVQQLDALIQTTNLAQRDATRALLIQMGLDPARIGWSAQPGDVVALTRTTPATTPCSAALKSDWQGDVANSITSLGTCVQANNLAEMVSDPRDLARPVALRPTNGAVAARAVQEWEQGAAKQSSRRDPAGEGRGGGDADPGGDAGAGGGAGGSIPSGAAAAAEPGTQSAADSSQMGARTLNPLLTPPQPPDLSGGD